MAKQTNYIRTQVRLPPELHKKLKSSSKDSSMNEEIVKRLEQSFIDPVELVDPEVINNIREIDLQASMFATLKMVSALQKTEDERPSDEELEKIIQEQYVSSLEKHRQRLIKEFAADVSGSRASKAAKAAISYGHKDSK